MNCSKNVKFYKEYSSRLAKKYSLHILVTLLIEKVNKMKCLSYIYSIQVSSASIQQRESVIVPKMLAALI